MPENSFAAIINAIRLLQQHSSRVGRTHIHKFLFLAEGWQLVPSSHPFSLYLHGPYSRQLDSDLLALRAAGIVEVAEDPAGYGARYSVKDRFAKMASALAAAENPEGLRELARVLAPMFVRELEAVSTCEYVRMSNPGQVDEEIIGTVRRLKPHLSKEDVGKALGTLRDLGAAALDA